MIAEESFRIIALEYKRAKNRLIILIYEGCLVPHDVCLDHIEMTYRVNLLLRRLTDDSRNLVAVISDAGPDILSHVMTNAYLLLVANGGQVCRFPGKKWQEIQLGFNAWIEQIIPSMRALTFEFEGSFLEVDKCSICWNYQNVNPALSEHEMFQILAAIKDLPASKYFRIARKDGQVEMRTAGIAKSLMLAEKLITPQHDFILTMGDESACETNIGLMYCGLSDGCCDITSSPSRSFQAGTQHEVLPLIERLLNRNYELVEYRH